MRPLFGGAIRCLVPNSFSDVSLIRQVPDNQEVFADPSSDSSLIIEVLEASTPASEDPRGAAAWHWDALAQDSGATSRTLVWAGALDGTTAAARAPNMSNSGGKLSLAAGLQSVPKFRDAEALANSVRVHLACVELPQVRTHLVLSTAAPQALHPAGAAHAPVQLQRWHQMLRSARPRVRFTLLCSRLPLWIGYSLGSLRHSNRRMRHPFAQETDIADEDCLVC